MVCHFHKRPRKYLDINMDGEGYFTEALISHCNVDAESSFRVIIKLYISLTKYLLSSLYSYFSDVTFAVVS